MNVALIGSVSSSYHALDALIRGGVEITGVLGLDESCAETVSDFTPLRALAHRANLPFQSFVTLDEPPVAQFLEDHPPDLLWVIGLSQLVSDRLIGVARHGGVGFHPTMLPRGRGRAPVAWTILLGERAAVSLFHLTSEPDAGDIIVQREVEVLPDDYSEDLIRRTNEVLSAVVLELAPRIRAGNLPRTAQDPSQATFYRKRTVEDGAIDWTQSGDSIYRLVRAAGRPYPGAFTFSDTLACNGQQRITVWRARPAEAERLTAEQASASPGEVLQIDSLGHARVRRGILVRTGDGGLWLTETYQADWSESPPDDAAGEGSEALRVGCRLGPSP